MHNEFVKSAAHHSRGGFDFGGDYSPFMLEAGDGGGEGGGGGGGEGQPPAFNPEAVPKEWLQEQVTKAIHDATEGRGLDGLKTHAHTLKGEKLKLQEQLDNMQKQLGGHEPSKLAEIAKKFQDEQERKLINEGKFDEVLNNRLTGLRKDHEAALGERDKSVQTMESRVKELTNKLREHTIDKALSEAAISAGVRKEALVDVLMRGRHVFQLDDELNMIARKSDGTAWFDESGRKHITPQAYLQLLAKDAPHLFPGSTGAGSSGGGGHNVEGNSIEVDPAAYANDPEGWERVMERAKKEGKQLQFKEGAKA